jgi:all-trans-8'-apo-beta-carotenal 15,15'-oxygenase
VPVLLHSAWMPRAVPSVDRDRLRFAAELDDAVLDAMEPELADIVRSVAVDLDDERG